MKRFLTVLLMFTMTCGLVVSMAASDYAYDIGDPDPEFSKRMSSASVEASFNVERDMWAVTVSLSATHADGRAFTEKDFFEENGTLYLDPNYEVETIQLASNGGGMHWDSFEVTGNTVFIPFDHIKPDENGNCDIYLSHTYIHLWEGHLIHRRTSNVVSIDYDKVLKLREQGGETDNPSQKTSSISGVVYDQYSREFIEDATVIIGGDTSVTDSGGNFYLYDVKPGRVTISVTKQGYYQLKDHIEVFPDTNYEGVEIQLEVKTGAADDDEESDGYKEDKKKASSGVSGVAVIGGVIAGAGLLFFRNGLRKKNKKYRKEKDASYIKNKKIEKEVKKLKPDYENKFVKDIEEEEWRLEKERMDKIKSMKRTDTDSLGSKIGKGIKGLLDKTKELTRKVKNITDKIQGEINKIKNFDLASYKGLKFKVGTLMHFVGNPFKKFEKIREAIDAFNDKNLYKWAKDEIKDFANVAKKLTDKISLFKNYKTFIENSKDIKKAINIHKEVNAIVKVAKNTDIITDPNAAAKLKDIRNNTPNIGTKLNEFGQKINKFDNKIKDTIKNKTTSFTNDITKEIK